MNNVNVLLKILTLLLLLPPPAVRAQQSTPLQGSWTASVGPTEIFRGMWAAETSPQDRNFARGSWTLLNDSGEVILQGTFSAKKIGTGWAGTWTARAAKRLCTLRRLERRSARPHRKDHRGHAATSHYEGSRWSLAIRRAPRTLVAEILVQTSLNQLCSPTTGEPFTTIHSLPSGWP
jgi:hypothetical protein